MGRELKSVITTFIFPHISTVTAALVVMRQGCDWNDPSRPLFLSTPTAWLMPGLSVPYNPSERTRNSTGATRLTNTSSGGSSDAAPSADGAVGHHAWDPGRPPGQGNTPGQRACPPARALKTRPRAAGRLLWPSGPEQGWKFRTAEVSVRQEGLCTQLLTAEQQVWLNSSYSLPNHTPACRASQSFLNSWARILLSRKHDDRPHHSKWLIRLTYNTNAFNPRPSDQPSWSPALLHSSFKPSEMPGSSHLVGPLLDSPCHLLPLPYLGLMSPVKAPTPKKKSSECEQSPLGRPAHLFSGLR